MGEKSVNAFIRKGKEMIGEDGVITFVISCDCKFDPSSALTHTEIAIIS